MAGYSSGSMLNQNTTSFPNNNSGQITPAILRDFNANLINSVQFTDVATPNAKKFDMLAVFAQQNPSKAYENFSMAYGNEIMALYEVT